MRVPKFRDLAQFVRFKRFWLVSGAQERARLSQHVKTVFTSQNKKDVRLLARKTQDHAEAKDAGDLRAPRHAPGHGARPRWAYVNHCKSDVGLMYGSPEKPGRCEQQTQSRLG